MKKGIIFTPKLENEEGYYGNRLPHLSCSMDETINNINYIHIKK